MAGLVIWIGSFFGPAGMIIALIISFAMNIGAWFFSDKIVLGQYQAQPVDEKSHPRLHNLISRLAKNADLPVPDIYIIPSASPNAFATGRDPQHAAVAVTKGALDILTEEELAGVMAHELAHVKDRDTLIMVVAASIAGSIMFISRMGMWFGGGRGRDNPLGIIGLLVMVILAPMVAMLVQMAISRTREYMADKKGAQFAQNPHGLANALEKLAQVSSIRPQRDLAEPATAHMWIASPLSGNILAGLFSTHPPIQERIKRLREMEV